MTEQPPGQTPRASSIAAEEAPASDLTEAQAPGAPQWPPLGAYPGEPGHPHPAGPPAPVAAAETVEGEVVWHQEPPAGPWHAKHEKPGEWRTHPPEHLAFEHSPPAEVQPGIQHDQPTEAIPLRMLPQPWEVPFDPHGTETAVADPPRRRRTALWVALALVLTLLLFGGGTLSALMLLRNADSGKGSPDPATAVDRFLTAAYTQQDAGAAGDLVCREARDQDQLKERINRIRGYANEYQAPVFRWTEPAVSGQSEKKAVVAVQLTMTTDDEKAAQQQLTFTVIRKTGWLVCDING
ncbi:hypothetical protein ACPCHT_25295 [Nucisporomicrobium flavum]|uniref:Rv0361 family membrane protein n=1 Tax=Nucisporomicrobium flavum TaxID=2785915 RepID=UPI003C2F04ED